MWEDDTDYHRRIRELEIRLRDMEIERNMLRTTLQNVLKNVLAERSARCRCGREVSWTS
jgi:hypothetical protein